MTNNYRDALSLLEGKLQFKLEEITATDLFYNDGDQRILQSFFKLIIPRGSSLTVVYIAEESYWVSFGSLTNNERHILDEWMNNLNVS